MKELSIYFIKCIIYPKFTTFDVPFAGFALSASIHPPPFPHLLHPPKSAFWAIRFIFRVSPSRKEFEISYLDLVGVLNVLPGVGGRVSFLTWYENSILQHECVSISLFHFLAWFSMSICQWKSAYRGLTTCSRQGREYQRNPLWDSRRSLQAFLTFVRYLFRFFQASLPSLPPLN